MGAGRVEVQSEWLSHKHGKILKRLASVSSPDVVHLSTRPPLLHLCWKIRVWKQPGPSALAAKSSSTGFFRKCLMTRKILFWWFWGIFHIRHLVNASTDLSVAFDEEKIGWTRHWVVNYLNATEQVLPRKTVETTENSPKKTVAIG